MLFRYEIRARAGFSVRAYTEALFYCGRHDTIAREFPTVEPLPGYFLNYFVGVAHLYMLRATGVAATTIQENGSVDIVRSGKVIGRVIFVDNECSYTDFEVTAN